MRPKDLSDVVGQENILGADGLLLQCFKSNRSASNVFLGPLVLVRQQ